MSDNYFGLDDILQENDSGHTLARGGASFLTVLFLALSSITTYMFFSTYAAGIGDFAGPDAAPIVSGVIGVLCLDVACLVWSYVRSRAATSAAQMAIALVISVIDLLLALVSSGLFIILSTSLETGVRDAAGALTEFGSTVNWVGVGVITAALIGNFASIFAWLHKGADTVAAEQKTTLRATVTAGQHKIDKERTGQIVNQTIADIKRQLPAAVDSMAARKSAEYVAAKLQRGHFLPAPNEPDAGQAADMDLEDLVTYLVEERLRERERTARPVPAYNNGDGPDGDARPTHRPDGR
jgi:hypothetical protein